MIRRGKHAVALPVLKQVKGVIDLAIHLLELMVVADGNFELLQSRPQKLLTVDKLLRATAWSYRRESPHQLPSMLPKDCSHVLLLATLQALPNLNSGVLQDFLI